MAATNNLIPDFDDFERYYSGEMSSAEQRTLEGRMLAEPLVAEAWEGFLAWRAAYSDAAAMRADLQARLHTRTAQARRKTLPLWAYASAASVLFAVFSYWAIVLRYPKIDMQNLSVTLNKKEAASLKFEQTPSPDQRDRRESAASGAEETKPTVPEVPAPASEGEEASNTLAKPEIGFAPSTLADVEVREEVAGNVLFDSVPAEPEPGQAPPTPAKTLATPGSAQAVTESMAGRARVKPKDMDTQYLVASKPVLARKETYTIVVPPDTLAAVPAEGWPAYRAYLDKNTGTAVTAGQIVVTFIVGPTGALSGFNARGPENLRKEAIRIISNGPAWAPARTRGASVASPAEIQLQFRQSQ